MEGRHTIWRYAVHSVGGTLIMISRDPITREEALQALRQHYGDRILWLSGGVR